MYGVDGEVRNLPIQIWTQISAQNPNFINLIMKTYFHNPLPTPTQEKKFIIIINKRRENQNQNKKKKTNLDKRKENWENRENQNK